MPAPDLMHQIALYVRPPAVTFWRWDGDSGAFTWIDRSTMVWQSEMHAVCERLAPRGLPPIGSLLLLIAATRRKWLEDQHRQGKLSRVGEILAERGCTLPRRLLPEVLVGLDAMSMTCRDLSGDRRALNELPAVVLGDCKGRTSQEVAEGVVQYLAEPVGESLDPQAYSRTSKQELTENACRASVLRFAAELHALRDGLARADAGRLRTLARTGVDELPEPAKVDIEEAQTRTAAELVHTLQQDEVYRGLGKLTRDLLAAIHIPRQLARSHDLPLGGVTDIANRGPLDRLLISELAQDDMTLAVRVAMNEALYLRRSDPPTLPRLQRKVLIDVGIRMWGVPRLFAAAVGLALAAAADAEKGMSVQGLTAKSQTGQSQTHDEPGGDAAPPTSPVQPVQPIDFTTREGLVDLLSRLTADRYPDPAPALAWKQRARLGGASQASPTESHDAAAFERESFKGDAIADEAFASEAFDDSDLVIVTHRDAFGDPAFRAALDACAADELFIAALDRDGAFELHARSKAGFCRIVSATLDLADVMPNEEQRRLVLDDSVDASLPAIFRVTPFPLYMPCAAKANKVWSVRDRYTFALTMDRRLLQFDGHARGGRQLMRDAPEGHVLTAKVDSVQRTAAIVTWQGNATLLRIDIATGDCVAIALEKPDRDRIVGGFFLDDNPVLVCAHHMAMHSPQDGRVIAVCDSDHRERRHTSGRYFVSQNNRWSWFAAVRSGTSLRLEAVDLPGNDASFAAVFETQGMDGPIALSMHGQLHFLSDGLQVPLSVPPRQVRSAEVSMDGRRIEVLEPQGRRVVQIHPHRQVGTTSSPLEPSGFLNSRSLRKRIQSVAISSRYELILMTSKQKRMRIWRNDQWMLLQNESMPATQRFVGFSPLAHPGTRLQQAKMPGGGRIVLDARGLLHLQPADPSLLEATLVLCDEHLSGWASDGTVWGDPYFIGGKDDDLAERHSRDAWEKIVEPILRDMR